MKLTRKQLRKLVENAVSEQLDIANITQTSRQSPEPRQARTATIPAPALSALEALAKKPGVEALVKEFMKREQKAVKQVQALAKEHFKTAEEAIKFVTLYFLLHGMSSLLRPLANKQLPGDDGNIEKISSLMLRVKSNMLKPLKRTQAKGERKEKQADRKKQRSKNLSKGIDMSGFSGIG